LCFVSTFSTAVKAWCPVLTVSGANVTAWAPEGMAYTAFIGALVALPVRGSAEDGAGCGGAIAVTDIYGERLVVDPLPVKADLTQLPQPCHPSLGNQLYTSAAILVPCVRLATPEEVLIGWIKR
jgi:hypothetical protein